MRRRAGRKPLGKRAMTGAERFRRWWLKHRREALVEQLARAKARVCDLEAQLRDHKSLGREM